MRYVSEKRGRRLLFHGVIETPIFSLRDTQVFYVPIGGEVHKEEDKRSMRPGNWLF